MFMTVGHDEKAVSGGGREKGGHVLKDTAAACAFESDHLRT